MTAQKGFTLVELVMVISVIAIISAFAGSRFTDSSNFSSLGARDQLIASSQTAQKRALAFVDASNPVVLTISQSDTQWQFSIFQGGTEIAVRTADRSGSSLRIGGSLLTNGSPATISFDENAETGSNTELTFSATSSHDLCISSSGFAYRGVCQS